MKILKSAADHAQFYLGKRELAIMQAILKNFPMLPPRLHRASRQSPPPNLQEVQGLLSEAMSAHQTELGVELEAMFKDSRRLKPRGSGYSLILSHADMDVLLRALNDIRVGCWAKLGSPGYDAIKAMKLDGSTAEYLVIMEITAAFQSALLCAMDPD